MIICRRNQSSNIGHSQAVSESEAGIGTMLDKVREKSISVSEKLGSSVGTEKHVNQSGNNNI